MGESSQSGIMLLNRAEMGVGGGGVQPSLLLHQLCQSNLENNAAKQVLKGLMVLLMSDFQKFRGPIWEACFV